jgi:hypothetical protein
MGRLNLRQALVPIVRLAAFFASVAILLVCIFLYHLPSVSVENPSQYPGLGTQNCSFSIKSSTSASYAVLHADCGHVTMINGTVEVDTKEFSRSYDVNTINYRYESPEIPLSTLNRGGRTRITIVYDELIYTGNSDSTGAFARQIHTMYYALGMQHSVSASFQNTLLLEMFGYYNKIPLLDGLFFVFSAIFMLVGLVIARVRSGPSILAIYLIFFPFLLYSTAWCVASIGMPPMFENPLGDGYVLIGAALLNMGMVIPMGKLAEVLTATKTCISQSDTPFRCPCR